MKKERMHKGAATNPENLIQNPFFSTNFSDVLNKIDQINPSAYAKTRNFINGAVTYLSPYISRGIIGLPFIKQQILKKYPFYQAEKLIQELAWREYFQRVLQHFGTDVITDIKQPQQKVYHSQIPSAIINATTGIDGIDKGINSLYETGYMHNHLRMYTAMLTCNIAGAHWLNPAKWMYYHLLDADLASNMLSWQWVAGTFSSKKYYANQENINKYLNTNQVNTYLDVSYEVIDHINLPSNFHSTILPDLKTELPTKAPISLNGNLPLLIYNSYQLDPMWKQSDIANRILLLEPTHFDKYPVSSKLINFIIAFAQQNIQNIQIFTGSFEELVKEYQAANGNNSNVFFKEHPLFKHYIGNCESRDWMFPTVDKYYPSFFSFWKKCEQRL